MRRIAIAGCFVLGLTSFACGQSSPTVTAFNEEVQRLWDNVRPQAEPFLLEEARDRLEGLETSVGFVEIKIREIRGMQFDWNGAPGLRGLAADRIEAAVPMTGTWSISVTAKVRVRLNLGFFRPGFVRDYTIAIDDLHVDLDAVLDTSDPARPTLRSAALPRLDFQLNLSSSGFVGNLFLRLVSPVATHLARLAIQVALQSYVMPRVQGFPGPVWADGTAPLTDSGAPTPFAVIAANVDRKVRDQHLTHGQLMRLIMSVPEPDRSWEAAYGPGGSGNSGTVVQRLANGDTCIWTGHYLASQALRYASGDPDALPNVRTALGGIAALIDINGGRGLIARLASPENAPEAVHVRQRGVYGRAVINGVNWIGSQGGSVSRDQISGAYMGLSLAEQHVPDPQVQAECRRLIVAMNDYLIANQWLVTEDRQVPPGDTPNVLTWVGYGYQQLAYLHMGNRVAPGRYDAELQRLGPLADAAWLTMWTEGTTLDSYFKFNLAHSTLYNYFRLETDPVRWQQMARANAMLRRVTGHHHNPHFDLIQASIDPSLQGVKFPSVREALRKYVQRNHRLVAPPVVNASSVQWVPTPVWTFGGVQQVSMPSEPVDITIRPWSRWWLWQKNPARVATPGDGDPRHENTGLDLLLPYWMGRYHGAF